MAQIIKFQTGGSLGSLTLGTKRYDANEELIQQLYDYSRTLDRETAYQFNFIIDALKSGANLSYANNTLSGSPVQFDTRERQSRRMQRGPAHGIGNREVTARKAISALENFRPAEPPKTEYDFSDTLTAEYSRAGNGTFITNDEDNKIWIEGPKNQRILQRLYAVSELAQAPEGSYEYTGPDGITAQTIIDWYNGLGEDEFNKLINRVQTGSWTPDDLEKLNDININLDRDLTQSEEATATEEQAASAAETARATENSARSSSNFSGDSNVSYNSNTGGFNFSNPTMLSEIRRIPTAIGPLWLNDEFFTRYPEFSHLKDTHTNGLFVIGDRVYDANDPELKSLELFRQFVVDNQNTGGNSRIFTQHWLDDVPRWTRANRYEENLVYNPFFTSEDSFIMDLTGQYQITPGEYLIASYPEQPDYDDFGRITNPIHKVYSMNNTDGEDANLANLVASDNASYYETQPAYMWTSHMDTENSKPIYKVRDGLYFNPRARDGQGAYYGRFTRGNTTRYFIMPEDTTSWATYTPTREDMVDLSSYIGNYKKGGIIKAQSGVALNSSSTRNITVPTNIDIFRNLGWLTNYDFTTSPINDVVSSDITPQQDTTNQVDDVTYGGYVDRNRNFYMSPETIFRLSDLGISLAAGRIATNKQKEAIREGILGALKTTPSEYLPIYNDNGISRLRDARISNIRKYIPTSSDAGLNERMRLVREDQVDQINRESGLQESSQLSQFNNKLLEVQANYATTRSNIENENRKAWHLGNAQLAMADANRVRELGENGKAVLLQMSQNYARDLENYKQLAFMDADGAFRAEVKRLFDDAGGYDAIDDESIRSTFSNAQNWLGAYAYINPEEYNRLQTQYRRNALTDPRFRSSWFPLWGFRNTQAVPSSKKGGTTPNINNKIYLERYKLADKGHNALNKDIMKLFMKMVK